MAFYKCHLCGDLHTNPDRSLCDPCTRIRDHFGDDFLAWFDKVIDSRASQRAEEAFSDHVRHYHNEDY